MKVVVASDSFKGSLTSMQVGQAVRRELDRLDDDSTCAILPMADGGEGTVEAVSQAEGAALVRCQVAGPLGDPVEAAVALMNRSDEEHAGQGQASRGWTFGALDGEDGTGQAVGVRGGEGCTRGRGEELSSGRPSAHGKCPALNSKAAVIEMASASGLTLVPPAERNPLRTSTFGTGQLIRRALDAGARTLLIAVGGSATNDGGMGCLQALGVRFRDAEGHELAGTGSDLGRVCAVDLSGIDDRLAECEVRVLSDVDNPLLGPHGAAATFAPQKGANAQQVRQLEDGMREYARVMAHALGTDFSGLPGTGAAGGLGFALQAVLHGRFVLGAQEIIRLVGLDQALVGADLCFTGEGHADEQTSHGKVVSCVAQHCRERGVPCIALVGGCSANVAALEAAGVTAVVPCLHEPIGLDEAIRDASANVAWSARQALRLFMAGRECPHPTGLRERRVSRCDG
ncbi:MAG: glycerate kinase [Coriobacteriales bacterium]|nr:glycerate kinase [Coriobacteriales bacterium]